MVGVDIQALGYAGDTVYNASRLYCGVQEIYNIPQDAHARRSPNPEHSPSMANGSTYIMPSSNKAKNVFDSGRTSSYHIKTIADCQQSSKSSSTFKIVLTRGGGTTKRYDFEAENPKMASEIVATIRGLKSSLERSGLLPAWTAGKLVEPPRNVWTFLDEVDTSNGQESSIGKMEQIG
ncbi:hypothetical protein D9756_011337 [Leucocoprinus leucothites]|uniref:SIN1-type PH domain-containing protein n=1 Tax=Leucocoprinus leucothites TaxID=201217 RepID=A0A8H5FNL5_9AGAR|nr:hypothetical protein D9756_011337 [Leucoagaricus leucothites]